MYTVVYGVQVYTCSGGSSTHHCAQVRHVDPSFVCPCFSLTCRAAKERMVTIAYTLHPKSMTPSAMSMPTPTPAQTQAVGAHSRRSHCGGPKDAAYSSLPVRPRPPREALELCLSGPEQTMLSPRGCPATSQSPAACLVASW